MKITPNQRESRKWIDRYAKTFAGRYFDEEDER